MYVSRQTADNGFEAVQLRSTSLVRERSGTADTPLLMQADSMAGLTPSSPVNRTSIGHNRIVMMKVVHEQGVGDELAGWQAGWLAGWLAHCSSG